ncbi:MAG TPA: efflux RND transporter periplasmic adaptor subunit [Caulobacteraceae bacterium]
MAIARRPTRPILIGVGVLAILILGFLLLHKKPEKTPAVQVVPVTAAKATAADFPVSISALGAAQPWKSDIILSQVAGVLTRVNFREGSTVKAGQVLAEVDPSTYRAAVTQAEGQLQRDQAVLAEAKTDLSRYMTLLGQDSISRQQAEDQQQVVKQDQGTVRVDQGVLDNARINLGRCRIVSPISGRAGVRLVDPGNLVSAGGSAPSTPSTSAATSAASPAAAGGSGIVVINQIHPIAVTFTATEGDFQRLVGASGHFSHPMAVRAFSQETGALIDTGQLSIADNRVDPATGTVELKANFPNAAERLWPGQFVNVQLTLQTLSRVTVIPTTAVSRGPKGPFVFVIGAGGKAVMRPVSIGAAQGALTMIRSGVRPGDTVVIDGQMTLKNGSLVRVAQTQQAAAGS